MNNIPINKKLGQMLMIGFHWTAISDELREMITDYGIGGVILFSRNIESPSQVKDLCNSLQKLSIKNNKKPLLIAIDQEVGRIFRLKPPFRQYPSYGELGRTGSEDAVRSNALLMADELIEIGVNMNMAPVLDVNTNHKNPIIGDRSFSSDPNVVSRLGSCVIKTFHEKGIIAVGKHFPGHGDTFSDSHLELPVVNHGIERLEGIEFKPFVNTFKTGLKCIYKWFKFYPFQSFYPMIYDREFKVGIRECISVSGEMFANCNYPLFMKCLYNT